MECSGEAINSLFLPEDFTQAQDETVTGPSNMAYAAFPCCGSFFF